MQITDQMLKAATKAIIVQMQCYDFGHLLDDGNFVTTEVKINLLEARAKEAARAALSAALSGTAEPVAFAEKDGDEWITYWPETNGTFEHIRDYPHVHQPNGPMPLFAAPPASDREVNGWQPIETAPKDGLGILLAFPLFGGDGYGVTEGQWDGVGEDEGWHLAGTNWCDCTDGLILRRHNEPTHWMPLPAPPVLNPEGSSDA